MTPYLESQCWGLHNACQLSTPPAWVEKPALSDMSEWILQGEQTIHMVLELRPLVTLASSFVHWPKLSEGLLQLLFPLWEGRTASVVYRAAEGLRE